MQPLTASKSRMLVGSKDQYHVVTGVALAADGATPAFPTGPTNGVVQFAGDFGGAQIIGFEFYGGTFGTITALDCNIEHSQDGENWYTLKALTQAASSESAKAQTDLDDTDPQAFRFLRANFSATGSWGTTAGTWIKVLYNQVGARGTLAPPGMTDKND